MTAMLIAGCGYVGSALGALLVKGGREVWALRRNAQNLPPDFRPLAADLSRGLDPDALPDELDCAFVTIAAGGFNDEAYRAAYVDSIANLLKALRARGLTPRRIFFTSSTGVYAQRDGEWVDEASPTEPETFSGRRLLEGERLLLESEFPSTVVRLGGIYGPGRDRLLRRVLEGEEGLRPGPPVYTNRIHRDDAAGILHFLMRMENPEAIYLGVDRHPAERNEVIRWIAEKAGIALKEKPASPEPESRAMRGNKRCRGDRLAAAGYLFRYPTYREGYGELLEALRSGGRF